MRWLAAIALALAPMVAPAEDRAFVVLGTNGTAVARIITSAERCPELRVDGRMLSMVARAARATVAQRPTLSTTENSKPSAFPVLTCDADLPRGAVHAAIGARRLPQVAADMRRVVVIGDTGCRLKASENAFQDCNDAAAFPFARIARQAARWKPDLVLHVGDYHYRENPCPPHESGCSGSPWGYGWDAWDADLFSPGAPLFAAAPWIVVRGNHESCARAGQGWWRFLDPRPLAVRRDCNRAEDDQVGDMASVYGVPIGGGAKVIVADLATAPDKAIEPDDPRFAAFASAYDAIATAANDARFAFVAAHKPILGIAATKHDGRTVLRAATGGTQSVFGTKNPDILPGSIDAVLSGHVHLWEQISYRSRFPSQFITGFSGTVEDAVSLPGKLPEGYTPVAGGVPEGFSSWVGGFGYMTLERRGARRWSATVWSLDGRVMNLCTVNGRHSRCVKSTSAQSRP